MRGLRGKDAAVCVMATMDVEGTRQPCWVLVEPVGSHTHRAVGAVVPLRFDGRRLARRTQACFPVKRGRLGALLHKQRSNTSSRDRRLAPHRATSQHQHQHQHRHRRPSTSAFVVLHHHHAPPLPPTITQHTYWTTPCTTDK